MPRVRNRLRLPIIAITLLALLFLRWYGGIDPNTPTAPGDLEEGWYQVERVVDGDTLVLLDGTRIRLIGADTPETVKPGEPVQPYGPEATAFTKAFVDQSGGRVYLRFDRERLDRYGRHLAYVWNDDEMLNEALIRAGLATAEPQYRYAASVKRRFLDAEEAAKSAGRGIWSQSP